MEETKKDSCIRLVDSIGRISLPAKMRRKIGLRAEDYFELYIDDENLYIKKYVPTCAFCKETSKYPIEFEDHVVCRKCLRALNELVKK